MGHRLSQIYTRTGDDGTTGLADGTRVSKDCARIELLGEIDELNARMGALVTTLDETPLKACLKEIQQLLFDLGGDLSIPGRESLKPEHTQWLETWMDHLNADLPPLREFVLPGGSQATAQAHLTRTGCRTAERRAVLLSRSENISGESLRFLNRLSDFLFVVCRVLGRASGEEHLWAPDRGAPPLPH